jgi:hypothetical protein
MLKEVSLVLVMNTLFTPAFFSSFSKAVAYSRVSFFSSLDDVLPAAPELSPPCPASIAMKTFFSCLSGACLILMVSLDAMES